MDINQKPKEKILNRELRNELYYETFFKDVSEFSVSKIEHLIELLKMEDDEEEEIPDGKVIEKLLQLN